MRHKKLKLSAIFLLGIGLTGLQAQEAIPVTGGNASGSGGSVSYSVGEVIYKIYTGTTGSVAHGVQQPFEISIVTRVEDAKGIDLYISAYPNPTTHSLNLTIEDYDYSNLSCQLFDMQGKLLESKKIEGDQTKIVMGNFVPGPYFLKLMQDNKEVKTFKIIKY